jgi:hypothetical protein
MVQWFIKLRHGESESWVIGMNSGCIHCEDGAVIYQIGDMGSLRVESVVWILDVSIVKMVQWFIKLGHGESESWVCGMNSGCIHCEHGAVICQIGTWGVWDLSLWYEFWMYPMWTWCVGVVRPLWMCWWGWKSSEWVSCEVMDCVCLSVFEQTQNTYMPLSLV